MQVARKLHIFVREDFIIYTPGVRDELLGEYDRIGRNENMWFGR